MFKIKMDEMGKIMLRVDLAFIVRTMRQIGEKFDKYMETADKNYVEEVKKIMEAPGPPNINLIFSLRGMLLKLERAILKANEYQKSLADEEVLRQIHEQIIKLREYMILQMLSDEEPTYDLKLWMKNMDTVSNYVKCDIIY